MIAAYTKSAPDGGEQGVRRLGLQLASWPGPGASWPRRRNLAAVYPNVKAGGGQGDKVNWKDYAEEVMDLMIHYKTKTKGGEGIAPELQSNIRLKGTQNGIEEKIRALAMKKLMPAGLAKGGARAGAARLPDGGARPGWCTSSPRPKRWAQGPAGVARVFRGPCATPA